MAAHSSCLIDFTDVVVLIEDDELREKAIEFLSAKGEVVLIEEVHARADANQWKSF